MLLLERGDAAQSLPGPSGGANGPKRRIDTVPGRVLENNGATPFGEGNGTSTAQTSIVGTRRAGRPQTMCALAFPNPGGTRIDEAVSQQLPARTRKRPASWQSCGGSVG